MSTGRKRRRGEGEAEQERNESLISSSLSIYLTDAEMAQCEWNGQNWFSREKTGPWGGGKGPMPDGITDLATWQGSKGEQAVARVLHFVPDNRRIPHPRKFDIADCPFPGQRTEIKTTNYGRPYFLIRVKNRCGHAKGEYEWIEPGVRGLTADCYIFCQTSPKARTNDVSIEGWISRDEIIEKYGDLYPAEKRWAGGAWLNNIIPRSALHPMPEFPAMPRENGNG